MATIVNERDILLQAASPRIITIVIPGSEIPESLVGIGIDPASAFFNVSSGGTASPTSITLEINRVYLTNAATWSVVSGSATLTGSGDTRSVAYASMSTDKVVIQASVTQNGNVYTAQATLAKVRDGTNGTNGTSGSNGTRGSVDIITTEAGFAGTWGSTQNAQATAAIAAATGTGPIVGDRVTIRNSSSSPTYIETRAWGGSWLTIGKFIAGNLIVDGTVAADVLAVNTVNGISGSVQWMGGVYGSSGTFHISAGRLAAQYSTVGSPNLLAFTDFSGSVNFAGTRASFFNASGDAYFGGTASGSSGSYTVRFMDTCSVQFQKTSGAPFSVSSSTQVNNLKAQYAGTADYATSAGNATTVGGLGPASFGTIVSTSSGTATSSNGYNFTVIGVSGVTSQGSGNTFSVVNTSDRRLKKDIAAETLGLDFINKLKPVTYRYRKDSKIRYHGFIYQDVCKLFLDVDDNDSLTTRHSNGIGGTDYMSLIGPLVNAVQTLSRELLTLKAEVALLKKD